MDEKYIPLSAALEAVCTVCSEKLCGLGKQKDAHLKKYKCGRYKSVKDIEPADVRPVVYGYWHDIYTGLDGIVTQTCSRCGRQHQTSISHEMPPLCPNCGADMRPEPPDREVEA